MKQLHPIVMLFLLAPFFLFAQQPGGRPAGQGGFRPQGPSITGKISGSIIDSVSKSAVEFATVVLIDKKTRGEVDGVITDDKGAFKFPAVNLGTYELHFSFLGYQPKVVDNVTLTPEKPDYDVPTVFFVPEGYTLDAVTVTGEAALIENRIDKMVFNAEKDATLAGGNATDVLQRVPMVAVDPDGNVSVRGSQNVQVLINGKPSTIFASNLADALKSMPADQIKSVEIITVPTAKFDGEGTGGIINIITKKKSVEGVTGSVNVSAGTRQNNLNLALNIVKGRFGLNFDGGTWYSWPQIGSSEFYRESTNNGVTSILDQEGESKGSNYGPRGSMGAFYDFNAYNSISSSLTFRGHGFANESDMHAVYNNPSTNIYQDYIRSNESNRFFGGFDWNNDFRRTFKTPEQELVFGVLISGSKNDSENKILQTGNDESLRRDEKNDNNSFNLETTLQLDYVHPFTSSIKLETGAKAILRTIDSDYDYKNFDFDQQIYVQNFALTNQFDYGQDVLAGYASVNVKVNKNYGFVIGARYEHTDIDGSFLSDLAPFKNGYDNILPSVIINRNLKNFQTLRLSFNQRISRPSLRYINPFTDRVDNRDITYGNPYLNPELTNQFELAYNTFFKGVVINASVFYRYTTDVIERYLRVDENGVSQTTFNNLGTNRSIGLNLFTSVTIAKILTVRGGANINSYDAEAIVEGETLSNTALLFGGNLNATLNLKKGYRIEAFGFYHAPRQSIQGRSTSFSMLNMGFRKELFQKRGGIALRIANPFSENREFRTETEGTNFYQLNVNNRPFRSIGFSFDYRFGKLDFKEPQRRRRGVSNDDLKDGGGQGEMNNN